MARAAAPEAVAAARNHFESLFGTWHIIVHFRDASASPARNREFDRWDDLVWVFSGREDGSLRWKECRYPDFNDKSGRFEMSRGSVHRVFEFWEPNDNQTAQLRRGPQVVGCKHDKQLHLLSGGLESKPPPMPVVASGSGIAMTLLKTWRVDFDSKGLPHLRQLDVMEVYGQSPFMEVEDPELDGLTSLRATSVERVRLPGDAQARTRIFGDFTRDKHRVGTFTMTRWPPVRLSKGRQLEQQPPDYPKR